MPKQPSAADRKRLAASVREALTLAGLPPCNASQTEEGGGFTVHADRSPVRVGWMVHRDLVQASWPAWERDRHHPLPRWEDRVTEAMLRTIGEILWAAGYTIALTPEDERGDIAPGLAVLAGRPRQQEPARSERSDGT